MNLSVKAWERQSTETTKAFAAFCMYRDLPIATRSIRESCQQFYGQISETSLEHHRKPNISAGKVRQMHAWSSKNNWVQRAQAWEEEKDRLNRMAQIEAVKEMGKRQAE
ncbi:MAG: hypothetical protein P1V97_36555, partial [Planctomycetota bacterium]|nr:hypothetical protein [Planctomycetota bacterium]